MTARTGNLCAQPNQDQLPNDVKCEDDENPQDPAKEAEETHNFMRQGAQALFRGTNAFLIPYEARGRYYLELDAQTRFATFAKELPANDLNLSARRLFDRHLDDHFTRNKIRDGIRYVGQNPNHPQFRTNGNFSQEGIRFMLDLGNEKGQSPAELLRRSRLYDPENSRLGRWMHFRFSDQYTFKENGNGGERIPLTKGHYGRHGAYLEGRASRGRFFAYGGLTLVDGFTLFYQLQDPQGLHPLLLAETLGHLGAKLSTMGRLKLSSELGVLNAEVTGIKDDQRRLKGSSQDLQRSERIIRQTSPGQEVSRGGAQVEKTMRDARATMDAQITEMDRKVEIKRSIQNRKYGRRNLLSVVMALLGATGSGSRLWYELERHYKYGEPLNLPMFLDALSNLSELCVFVYEPLYTLSQVRQAPDVKTKIQRWRQASLPRTGKMGVVSRVLEIQAVVSGLVGIFASLLYYEEAKQRGDELGMKIAGLSVASSTLFAIGSVLRIAQVQRPIGQLFIAAAYSLLFYQLYLINEDRLVGFVADMTIGDTVRGMISQFADRFAKKVGENTEEDYDGHTLYDFLVRLGVDDAKDRTKPPYERPSFVILKKAEFIYRQWLYDDYKGGVFWSVYGTAMDFKNNPTAQAAFVYFMSLAIPFETSFAEHALTEEYGELMDILNSEDGRLSEKILGMEGSRQRITLLQLKHSKGAEHEMWRQQILMMPTQKEMEEQSEILRTLELPQISEELFDVGIDEWAAFVANTNLDEEEAFYAFCLDLFNFVGSEEIN